MGGLGERVGWENGALSGDLGGLEAEWRRWETEGADHLFWRGGLSFILQEPLGLGGLERQEQVDKGLTYFNLIPGNWLGSQTTLGGLLCRRMGMCLEAPSGGDRMLCLYLMFAVGPKLYSVLFVFPVRPRVSHDEVS